MPKILGIEPDITEDYVRYRIRNPSLFKPDSFRTLDIGRSGYHKLIRAITKKTNKFKTQSVIVEKDHADEHNVKKETSDIIRRAKAE